jgi:hypothetical protein
MAIPYPPMQNAGDDDLRSRPRSLSDAAHRRHRAGRAWVPSWMRQMESALEAFSKSEERLRLLELRPSEYVRRQIRVTPYPSEPVGWIIEQTGEEVCSSRPTTRTSKAGAIRSGGSKRQLGDASEQVRQRFYCDNFVDLMGAALAG